MTINLTQSIFLVGPMGAGKSSIGKQLANKLKLAFFDSDIELEKRAGASISWIFDVEGEPGMRDREEKVIEELTAIKSIVLATGGGSILRPNNRTVLAARGIVIYLKTPIEQQLKRTKHNRGHRPLLQVEDTESRIKELAEVRNPLYEAIADYTLTTNRSSTYDVVDAIIQALS